jgi:ABC-type nickel/cobalt efflux system permease component RcnA
MSEPTPPGPPVLEPVPDSGVRPAVIGLVLWGIALVACVLRRDALAARGAGWWTATAACGLVIGAGLLVFTLRRARVYREHDAQVRAAGAQDPDRTP